MHGAKTIRPLKLMAETRYQFNAKRWIFHVASVAFLRARVQTDRISYLISHSLGRIEGINCDLLRDLYPPSDHSAIYLREIF
jgi:hypothetical protein